MPDGAIPAAAAAAAEIAAGEIAAVAAGERAPRSAADAAVAICADLLRIDTSNYGTDDGPGERTAAEYCATVLADAGLPVEIIEPRARRTTVMARWPGLDRTRPPLLIHAHTDVVPAEPATWSRHPFGAELADGCLWGRGAVDMKYFVAQVLAVIRAWSGSGQRPARDVVLAFVADEENGGQLGARWLVEHRRDLLDDCTEAIGEVGGYSARLPTGQRLYFIETAQKGVLWFEVTARGPAGHASMINDGNSVVNLAEVVARIGRHEFPYRLTPTTRALLQTVADCVGEPFDPADPEALLRHLGPAARMIASSLRDIASPTELAAGGKTNVIPPYATARFDCRFLPGSEEACAARMRELIGPGVDHRIVYRAIAVETEYSGPVSEAIKQAVTATDPGAITVPYLLPAGSDAKHFSQLGINCFGFAPLQLPDGFDFPAAFHGVDERVPVDAIRAGVAILERFLRLC